MTADDNKLAAQRFLEHAWNSGDYDHARDHLVPESINHTPVGEEARDDFLARIRMFREAFPEFYMTIDDMLADGDLVITRWTGR